VYEVTPQSFANQLQNLRPVKVKKVVLASFGTGQGVYLSKKRDVQTNINKIYCYNKNGVGDSLKVRDYEYRFTFNNGTTKRGTINYLLVRNNYFLVISDTNMNVRARCKSCRTPVDSVKKVEILGP
jgi:hypothetical protein